MRIDITQEEFERVIHAAAACNKTIYEAVLPYMQKAYETVKCFLLEKGEEQLDKNARLLDLTKEYVCCHGFLLAIRHLDLVITDSGFGVVSNDHVAPASRDRVDALKEAVSMAEARCFIALLQELFTVEGWGEDVRAKSLVPHLAYDTFAMAELCGRAITRGNELSHSGNEIRGRSLSATMELARFRREVYDAWYTMANSLGFNVLNELRDAMITNSLTEEQEMVAYGLQHSLARLVTNKSDENITKAELRNIINYMDGLVEQFPSYKNDTPYKARHMKRYENRQKSPAFFFG